MKVYQIPNFDRMTPAGRVSAFDAIHGEKIQAAGWWYFQDGACREVEIMGALVDPPDDEYALCENKVQFYHGKLDRAVREFDVLKASLWGGFQDREGLARLKELQKEVTRAAKALDDARAALHDTPKGKMLEAYYRGRAEQSEQAEQWRNELREIQV